MQKDEQYLIRKGGYYYRPNARGYTVCKSEAGRFTLDEAVKHSHPNGPSGPRDGISYELDDEPPVAQRTDADADTITALQAEVARLREHTDTLLVASERLRDDLYMRGEKNALGIIVVNVSQGRWVNFNLAIEKARKALENRHD